jgi:hypothetical protein
MKSDFVRIYVELNRLSVNSTISTMFWLSSTSRTSGRSQRYNPLTKQCDRGKQEHDFSQYDNECISGHCGMKKGSCQQKTVASLGTIVPSVIASTVFLVIIIIVVIYQKLIATLINSISCINKETKPPLYGSIPRHQC